MTPSKLKQFREADLERAEAEMASEGLVVPMLQDIADVNEETYDLSVKNPNLPQEAPLRDPKEILAEMESLDSETNSILKSIKDLI